MGVFSIVPQKPKVWLAEGRTGSGKTYDAIRQIVDEILPTGASVVTIGIDIDRPKVEDYLRRFHFYELPYEQLKILTQDEGKNFHLHLIRGVMGKPSYVFFDEVQNVFNARDWANTSREILKVISHHRHYHVSLCFMTQNVHNVDKQFLRQMHFVTAYRDMQGYKFAFLPGYWLPETWKFTYDYDMKTVLKPRERIMREKTIYELYNSFQEVEGVQVSSAVADASAKSRAMLLDRRRRYHWRLAGVWAVVLFLACGGSGCKVLDWRSKAKKVDEWEKQVKALELRIVALETRGPGRVLPARSAELVSPIPKSVTGSIFNGSEGVYIILADLSKLQVGSDFKGGRVVRLDFKASQFWVDYNGMSYPVWVR